MLNLHKKSWTVSNVQANVKKSYSFSETAGESSILAFLSITGLKLRTSAGSGFILDPFLLVLVSDASGDETSKLENSTVFGTSLDLCFFWGDVSITGLKSRTSASLGFTLAPFLIVLVSDVSGDDLCFFWGDVLVSAILIL